MLLRNLMAMDTEEMMKAHPIDGVMLLGGCDKTVPAQLMAAASANIPAIVLTGGPMLNGRLNGRSLGACTDCYSFTLEHKAGNITDEELAVAEDAICRSNGHCMVMGTASTMASIAEAIGMALPGCATIPAPDSRRKHMSERTGHTVKENLAMQPLTSLPDVIHTMAEPLDKQGGIAVLRGNLAPDGALIKQTAVSGHLKKHKGRAVVFDSPADLTARMDNPELDVDESCVLVLKNAGPKGAPAMPEIGQIPIPSKLLKKGIRDMVRISDARISGTSYGALIVHAAPEAAIGGTLALVEEGDEIELDIAARKLQLLVSDEELAERRKAWIAPKPHYDRDYGLLFHERVLQANLGCDFDFLLPPELRAQLQQS